MKPLFGLGFGTFAASPLSPRQKTRAECGFCASSAEGEGFEPSSDVTARNGFRDSRRRSPICPICRDDLALGTAHASETIVISFGSFERRPWVASNLSIPASSAGASLHRRTADDVGDGAVPNRLHELQPPIAVEPDCLIACAASAVAVLDGAVVALQSQAAARAPPSQELSSNPEGFGGIV